MRTDAPLRAILDSNELKKYGIDKEGMQILRGLASVSEEAMVAWVNRIKDQAPALFKLLSSHLLFDIEMNVVIQKHS